MRRGLTAVLVFSLLAVLPAAGAGLSDMKTGGAASLLAREFTDLEGGRHRLSRWRGKVLIVNFWAGWCGPCQFEIPHLKRWQSRYGKAGLQVVGIGVDERARLKNVARSLEIDYPQMRLSPAEGRKLLAELGNRDMAIPFTIVIDRAGKIALSHNGALGEEDFEFSIKPLL